VTKTKLIALVAEIAQKLHGMDWEDLTQAERRIVKLLAVTGFVEMVENEHKEKWVKVRTPEKI
jgi:hypothetical protein